MNYDEAVEAIKQENIRHRREMKKIDRRFYICNFIIIAMLIISIFYKP